MTAAPSTTSARPGTRRLAALLAVVLLLLAGVNLAVRATAGAAAAWSDDVHTTTDVALGTWSAPMGPDGCVVRDPSGTPTGQSCSLGLWPNGFSWGSEWYQHYTAQLWFTIDGQYPGYVAPGYTVEFQVTLPTSDQPAWWSWDGAGVVAIQTDAPSYALTSSCGQLPVVSGTISGPISYFQVEVEPGAATGGASGLLCTP
ncbi:hypothetical protein [Actinotalea sp. JY-7876]|uniref:hypothetical protein n=1 Tax=Actinotalea sp. JY-7876 TaxID=2758442 RepID=UPI0015F539EA|nr:hypothetical protein [Actinotalea sp. JY-7876]